MTIIRHINELIEERNRLEAEVTALRAELSSPARFLVPPRVVVQSATPEEAAQVVKFLAGSRNITVAIELISADVAEENKRLRELLTDKEARIKTLQGNLLGLVGLGAVYAGGDE